MMDGSYTPDTLTHEQRIRNFNIKFRPATPCCAWCVASGSGIGR